MKSEVAISLSSSLLLLLLFLSGPSEASSAHPKPVLDIHGHPVLTGTKYYLDFGYGAISGGVTMGQSRNGACPLDVVRDRPLFHGLPVTLTLAEGSAEKGTAVHSFTSVKIEFSGPEAESVNTCQSSMGWSVGSNDDETGLRTITTGGSASFAVLESGLPHTTSIYKLVYCGASICVGEACTKDYVCRVVGQSDGRRLFAGGPAFYFFFRKA